MARRKRSGRRRKGMLGGFRIGAGIGMVVGLYQTYAIYKQYKGTVHLPVAMVHGLTGYDYSTGNFDIKKATIMLPMVGGAALSMVASKVGLNRYTPTGINI